MLSRFSPILLVGGFVVVCALMFWPSAVQNNAQAAVDQANTNLQVVVNAARTAQQRHIALTRDDIVRLVNHLNWQYGSITYFPRVTGLMGKKYWAVVVTAQVKPGLDEPIQTLEGPNLLPQLYVRSWDLNLGVQSFAFNTVKPVTNHNL